MTVFKATAEIEFTAENEAEAKEMVEEMKTNLESWMYHDFIKSTEVKLKT